MAGTTGICRPLNFIVPFNINLAAIPNGKTLVDLEFQKREMASIKTAAKLKGMSVPDYLAALIKRDCEEHQDDAVATLGREVSQVGVELAKWMNAMPTVPRARRIDLLQIPDICPDRLQVGRLAPGSRPCLHLLSS